MGKVAKVRMRKNKAGAAGRAPDWVVINQCARDFSAFCVSARVAADNLSARLKLELCPVCKGSREIEVRRIDTKKLTLQLSRMDSEALRDLRVDPESNHRFYYRTVSCPLCLGSGLNTDIRQVGVREKAAENERRQGASKGFMNTAIGVYEDYGKMVCELKDLARDAGFPPVNTPEPSLMLSRHFRNSG